jgi:hypothetical protein
MSEDYSAAAERIVIATNLADDDLSSFEDDVRTVALGYLDQAARISELEAALAWYADESHYDLEERYSEDPRLAAKGVTYRSYPVLDDNGEHARAALAPGAAGRSSDARPVDPPDCPRCHRRMIPYQRDPERWWICGRDDCRLVPISRTDA